MRPRTSNHAVAGKPAMSSYVWLFLCIVCLSLGGFVGYLLGSAIGNSSPYDDD